jgi:ribosomal-protein-alanine N-acetyltransferase
MEVVCASGGTATRSPCGHALLRLELAFVSSSPWAFHSVPSSFHSVPSLACRCDVHHDGHDNAQALAFAGRQIEQFKGVDHHVDGYHGDVSVTTRLVTRDDVPTLVDLLRADREFLAPWEPLRTDEFFTIDYQDTAVARSLEQCEQGAVLPHVILDDGDLVGRITLNNIVRGPLQSAKLGSWVASSANGRGVATAAVAAIIPIAFDDLKLHRIAAATLLHNVRSQRVLERCGFARIGVAPRYLQIAGEYQDHALYQRLADDDPVSA